MKKISKEVTAFIIALAMCCAIMLTYYNYLLSNSRHMQDIKRFDKIEEILRKGQTKSIDI